MNRVSLHTRSFRRIHFSVFKYGWTKNGRSTGSEKFPGLSRNGPLILTTVVSLSKRVGVLREATDSFLLQERTHIKAEDFRPLPLESWIRGLHKSSFYNSQLDFYYQVYCYLIFACACQISGYISLTNRVRGPYRKLRTEFFPPRFMAQARSARAINRRGKNEDP